MIARLSRGWLRELGGEPPLTDFVAWIWLDRPPADWGDDDAA